MELESQVEAFKKRGLGVAALSYDTAEVLKGFAARRKISFPLLSDPDSRVIQKFGIMNTFDYPEGHMAHGVPFPGTFVTDAQGVIRTREFEKTYQERKAGASLLTSMGEDGVQAREFVNNHFTLKTSLSNEEVATGRRVTLVLDFTMAPRMHAYAPGAKGYRALNLRLVDHPRIAAHEVIYPSSNPLFFEPLKETVPVFEGRFRVLQDVTVLAPAGTPGVSGAPPSPVPLVTEIVLAGTLDYQACSDTVCYAPSSIPIQWTLKLIPLDRERAPEALRRKP